MIGSRARRRARRTIPAADERGPAPRGAAALPGASALGGAPSVGGCRACVPPRLPAGRTRRYVPLADSARVGSDRPIGYARGRLVAEKERGRCPLTPGPPQG